MLAKYINTEVLLGIVYTNYNRHNNDNNDSQTLSQCHFHSHPYKTAFSPDTFPVDVMLSEAFASNHHLIAVVQEEAAMFRFRCENDLEICVGRLFIDEGNVPGL